MKRKESIPLVKRLVLLIMLAVLLVFPQAVSANVRIENGGEVPFYARLGSGEIYTDGVWVVIVFYRPPDCVPPDFDLLDFFNFATASECQPVTTDGFEIWKHGPGIDMAPLQQKLYGRGSVPVWFVSLQELQSAIADEDLSIGELASLSSLMTGSAGFYQEVLHPTGGANNSHIVFNARGSLADGTPFVVHAMHTETNYNVSIRIGP